VRNPGAALRNARTVCDDSALLVLALLLVALLLVGVWLIALWLRPLRPFALCVSSLLLLVPLLSLRHVVLHNIAVTRPNRRTRRQQFPCHKLCSSSSTCARLSGTLRRLG
jgi:hypothetical protein